MTTAFGDALAPWRRTAAAVLASMVLWPLAPVLSAYHVPFVRPACELLGKWFELQCERDPARSLHLLGIQLGVCARCSGIYWGLGLGALFKRPRLSGKGLLVWVTGAALVMLLDVELEARALHGAWPVARVATGLLLGLPLGAVLARALRGVGPQPEWP